METILIIEDEESISMALEDDLGLEGYEVAAAKDGLQGLSMARENGYDLIILDIILGRGCVRFTQDGGHACGSSA